MKKKLFSVITLTLLMSNLLTLALYVQPIATRGNNKLPHMLQNQPSFFIENKKSLGHQMLGLGPDELRVISMVNGSNIYQYDLELEGIALNNHAFRSGGSPGANETAEWILNKFRSFGLEAYNESFKFVNWNSLSKPVLTIDIDGNLNTTDDQTPLQSFSSMHLSWPTPPFGVFSDLVVLPLPEAGSREEIGVNPIDTALWNSIDTTGKILLIGMEVHWDSGWRQSYLDKITVQPPAAIVYTWWYDWMSFTPLLYPSSGGRPLWGGGFFWDLKVPVGGVNYQDGSFIRSSESDLNVSANVVIESEIGYGTHYNVIGKIRGQSDPEKYIIVSSHYDTVMSAGFCDNGAGTAGVIELARVFSEAIRKGWYLPRFTILFITFADEEFGLVGSINYLIQHKDEIENVVAVVNLDGIGSDQFRVSETDPDPDTGLDLDQLVLKAAQDLGVNASLISPGGSDQETFRNPSGVNSLYNYFWGLDAGIESVPPVEPSALLISFPLLYRDYWDMGEPGWIHTSYDNSTSTAALSWIEENDLENHVKIATLTLIRAPGVSDVAVTNVTISKTVVGQGYPVSISVTVENQGDFAESFNVTAYANTTQIGKLTANNLANGTSTTIAFTWNTTGFAKGNYTISAVGDTVPGEVDTTDNTLTEGWVIVAMVGDVSGPDGWPDGKVNIMDLTAMARIFGVNYPDPRYNPNYDLNDDGKINIADLTKAAKHFGLTDP